MHHFQSRWNSLPIPSIAIPTSAKHSQGTPCGVLIHGQPGQDLKLLRFALALEKALKAQTQAEATLNAESPEQKA